MRLKVLAANLLLLVVACGVGLAVATGLLAWLAPANPMIYQVDAACLMRLRPGGTKRFQHLRVNGGGNVMVHVNTLGLRGEELPAANHGKRRIVVYGDSFVEAEFSPVDETFAKRLEARLAADGMAVEVFNAGVVGYGPDQVCVRLETELPRLRPELVIVAIASGNDFGDLLRNKIFRLGPDGRLVRNRPVLHWSLRSHLASLSGGTALQEGPIARHWRRLRWELLRRYLEKTGGFEPLPGEDVIEWSLRACQKEYEDDVVEKNDVVVNLLLDHYDADVALRPDSDSARYKVALMEQVLVRIRDTLATRGIPLLLVLVPDVIDESPRHHFAIKSESLAGHVPARLTDVLEGIAGRLGIPCVNLFGRFRSGKPERLYFRDPETHWNAAGQELAARVTTEALLSSGLLQPIALVSSGG
jgi:hypothetical protein